MAGGAVAREVLKLYSGVEVLAYVQSVQDVRMPEDFDRDSVTLEDVEASITLALDSLMGRVTRHSEALSPGSFAKELQ